MSVCVAKIMVDHNYAPHNSWGPVSINLAPYKMFKTFFYACDPNLSILGTPFLINIRFLSPSLHFLTLATLRIQKSQDKSLSKFGKNFSSMNFSRAFSVLFI